MKHTSGRGLRHWAAAAALGVASIITACGGGGNADDAALQSAIAQAERDAPAGKRPIVETHIHFWQVSRPGGVPWPTAAEGSIFRDFLPPEYSALAKPAGVVKTVVIEASGIVEDNQWLLNLIKGDPFYYAFVGNLDIGAPTFTADLA
ncbi:MAG: hypothetical protein ABIU07_16150, partial [Ramlibacter sp.]